MEDVHPAALGWNVRHMNLNEVCSTSISYNVSSAAIAQLHPRHEDEARIARRCSVSAK